MLISIILRYITLLICITLSYSAISFAADNLKNAFNIAKSAAKMQSERINIAAENIANSNTTPTRPGEEPYRRKLIFAQNKYNRHSKTYMVQMKKIANDQSTFLIRYDPSNPASDQGGYIQIPNITVEIEKADVLEASKSYEANLSVMELTKQMINKTLETIR